MNWYNSPKVPNMNSPKVMIENPSAMLIKPFAEISGFKDDFDKTNEPMLNADRRIIPNPAWNKSVLKIKAIVPDAAFGMMDDFTK